MTKLKRTYITRYDADGFKIGIGMASDPGPHEEARRVAEGLDFLAEQYRDQYGVRWTACYIREGEPHLEELEEYLHEAYSDREVVAWALGVLRDEQAA